MFLYSKLLRLFRIDYMFTSLRLRVMWRTEQVIYYIHKSNVGVSCLLLSCHVGLRLGIAFISSGVASSSLPLLSGPRLACLSGPMFFNNSIINSIRYSLSAVPS